TGSSAGAPAGDPVSSGTGNPSFCARLHLSFCCAKSKRILLTCSERRRPSFSQRVKYCSTNSTASSRSRHCAACSELAVDIRHLPEDRIGRTPGLPFLRGTELREI